ncbi:hypothetical protein [Micropruina sonneratiae]|nr:hypothetical protein [Micropruina sp. KQZ13P-5]MCW3159374.1 hypothetical protein [Micropruina sp. KQZ13P-5]
MYAPIAAVEAALRQNSLRGRRDYSTPVVDRWGNDVRVLHAERYAR